MHSVDVLTGYRGHCLKQEMHFSRVFVVGGTRFMLPADHLQLGAGWACSCCPVQHRPSDDMTTPAACNIIPCCMKLSDRLFVHAITANAGNHLPLVTLRGLLRRPVRQAQSA